MRSVIPDESMISGCVYMITYGDEEALPLRDIRACAVV